VSEIALFLSTNYRSFGLAGCAIIIFAMLFTAVGYSGRKQEKYSALNHFISELGEAGVSARAQVFNGGLIVGGLLLIPFIIGFGIFLHSLWATLAIVSGVWAAISCMLVGVFPMNNLNPHIKAAVSYFRAGLVMVFLFGIAILVQPAGPEKVSSLASVTSLLAVLAYASFLFLLRKPEDGAQAGDQPLDPDIIPDRPRVWILPALEWLVFVSTIIWFFANAFFF